MVAQSKASNLDDATRRIVDQGLFQLMQRANYSTENLGHFGLNLDAYVHFTSPIRRYPDLVAHRQLKALLKGQDWPHEEDETTEISETPEIFENLTTFQKLLRFLGIAELLELPKPLKI